MGLADALGRAAARLDALWRRPYLLIEVTTRCNLDCRYCYNVWKNDASYPVGELSTAETLRLLDKALTESTSRQVTLTGGEPLLRDDLETIVAHLVGRGVRCSVVTNGTLLDGDRAARLVEAGVSLFEVPILATDRAVHDDLTGPGAFDRALEAVADVRLAGGRVAGAFVATKRNLDQWPDVLRLGLAIGLEGLLFNRFNPGGRGAASVDELLLTSRADLEAALTAADAAAAEHGLPVAIAVPVPPCVIDPTRYANLTFTGCLAGTADAYWTLDPHGNVRPCNHSPRILGNLRRESFAAIASPARLEDWREAVPAACRPCRHLPSCGGGCRAAAHVCTGRLDGADPFVACASTEGRRS